MTGMPTSPATVHSPTGGAVSELSRTDVFISYSRKDKAFVERLAAAFKHRNRDPWVDWDDIHKGEEWWQAIQQGIEAADTFIFVVSPDSVASPRCRDEIKHAVEHNKRFLPIVWREGFDSQQLHPEVASHNWLFFRETDDFQRTFPELLTAMDTDLDHLRAHTRLLVRALEWHNKGQNPSYLLRGSDLQEAQQWLMQAVSKTPQPTEQQATYIRTSQAAATAQLQARKRAKWIVLLTTVLANLALFSGGSYWLYTVAIDQTNQQVQENLVRALKAGLVGIDGDEFEALATLQGTEGSAPISNPLYQRHQRWLGLARTIFLPKINLSLRTYVQGNRTNEILWIGDSSRLLPDNTTRETTPASGTSFREVYTAEHAETQVYNLGRERVGSLSLTPYSDRLGRWVSASGPIANSQGQIVGGLRVDFREDYVVSVQRAVGNFLFIAYAVMFVWLLTLSLIILRVTRPADDLPLRGPLPGAK